MTFKPIEVAHQVLIEAAGWQRRDIARQHKRDDGIPTRADLRWAALAAIHKITG